MWLAQPHRLDILIAGTPLLPGHPHCRDTLTAGTPSLQGHSHCRDTLSAGPGGDNSVVLLYLVPSEHSAWGSTSGSHRVCAEDQASPVLGPGGWIREEKVCVLGPRGHG